MHVLVNLYAGNSTVSSAWTSTSPRFTRPGVATGSFSYQAFFLRPSSRGEFLVRSASTTDTYGCLYLSNFNPASPSLNLMMCDDDAGGNGQFSLYSVMDPSATYILIATTYRADTTGSFSIVASGSRSINITSVADVNTLQSTTTVPTVLTGTPSTTMPISGNHRRSCIRPIGE
jgi:hypothetical protein